MAKPAIKNRNPIKSSGVESGPSNDVSLLALHKAAMTSPKTANSRLKARAATVGLMSREWSPRGWTFLDSKCEESTGKAISVEENRSVFSVILFSESRLFLNVAAYLALQHAL